MSEGEKKLGRPTVMTMELMEEICVRITQGLSINTIGGQDDMPDPKTIWTWINRREDFLLRYTRAIQARSMIHAERIDELAELAIQGKIAPDAARVAIDAKKWTASRLLPKIYGDRQQVEATVTHTHTLHLEALKELANKVRGNDLGSNDAQVIDIVANQTFHAERSLPVQALPPVPIGAALASDGSDPPGPPTPRGAGAGAPPPLTKNKKQRREKTA